jgi:tripartite-type tricarboxylate transporter receptor subunit TctC
MKRIFKIWRIACALVVAGLSAAAIAQQPYPTKLIRFVVPYSAGGSVEPLVRLFTAKLTESLGQPMLVDLRPGGNTIIGTELVAKAAPDGYTVLVMTVPNHAINALLIPNLPYDSMKDFAPVTTISTSDYLLVLHPSVPADNLKAFIALAKSRPGELNYGSVGSAGISQLGVETFCMMTGIKMQRVPYKGSAPALIDLISGQLHAGFNTPISAIRHVHSRRLKAIAISGEQRNTALPEVPTFSEAGLPGFEMRVTYAVMAPAGTPRAVIEKLSGEFGKIVAMPEIREKLAQQGMTSFHSTPDQLAALLKADLAKYAKVIKAADIKLE